MTGSAQTLAAALDFVRYDEIAVLAESAASYWWSLGLAAERREPLTVVRRSRQVGAVTCAALEIVKALGQGPEDRSDPP
jgi:hypothetical protein